MWRRRIVYALALIAALLGQLFDVGYLFHYIFFLTLTLPVIGLAVSLPAMLGARAFLTAASPCVRRNAGAGWSLVLYDRFSLPLARVKGRVTLENCLTGQRRRTRRAIRGVGSGEMLRLGVDTSHCGLIRCRADRLWVCDCLGLFSLPVKSPAAGTLLVIPTPEPPKKLELPEGSGLSLPVPRGKSASGEDYELRAYQPGDTMRIIHWKMSAKRDELVSRELLEDKRPTPVLTVDHFGPLHKLDRAFDRLAGYSEAMLERQRPHEIRWVHPETGTVRRYAVACQRDWMICLTALLSDPAPPQGRSILEAPLAVDQDQTIYHIHVAGEEADRNES